MPSLVHALDELTEQECRRLLGARPLGRLGFTEGALPRILPVHYTVRADELIVASLAGVKVAAAARGDILVFEVDSYDPATREGWCVSAVGPSRLVTDPARIAELDALGFAPFTPEQDRHYIAIQIGVIQGRRLSRREKLESIGRAAANGRLAPSSKSPGGALEH